jgi:hypothetical protein
MYPFSLLIEELENSRRRLRYIFEVPDGTPTRKRESMMSTWNHSVPPLDRTPSPPFLPNKEDYSSDAAGIVLTIQVKASGELTADRHERF